MEQVQEQIRKVTVGNIFYTSWGYDQTNYDFLVVLEISPTGKTAKCQMVELESNVPDGQCNKQRPSKNGYGKVFRMRIEQWEGKPQLRGSYPYCSNDQSTSRLDTFSLDTGKEYWETDSMFGH